MELPVSEAIVDLVLLATNGLLLAASEEYGDSGTTQKASRWREL